MIRSLLIDVIAPPKLTLTGTPDSEIFWKVPTKLMKEHCMIAAAVSVKCSAVPLLCSG